MPGPPPPRAEPRAPAAAQSTVPSERPRATTNHTPALPQARTAGPTTSRPTGLPSPLAVITAVITFARSASGGRVERIPIVGALTIGTKNPHTATAAHTSGQEMSAAIVQSGIVASTIATLASLSG